MAIEKGSIVNYEGMNYKVLYFHKGFGSSELTAKLQNVDDGSLRDVLKRKLDECIVNIEPNNDRNIEMGDIDFSISSVDWMNKFLPNEDAPVDRIVEEELKKRPRKNKK